MTRQSPKSLDGVGVADAIRRGIASGELVPGQRLVVAELRKMFAARRSAVNAALEDLLYQGVVEHVPHRGIRVRLVSLQEALQIAEVRIEVEGVCAAHAAERITAEEIAELRAFGCQMEQAVECGDPAVFSEMTHHLLHICMRIADQPVASEVLTQLRDRNSRHRYRLGYRTDRSRVSLPLWQALIEALCQRNPEAARLAVLRRGQNAMAAMLALAEDRSVLGLRS